MIAEPSRAIVYTKAAICRHNYLRILESSVYCPPGFIDVEDGSGNCIDGGWRGDQDACSGMESAPHIGSNRYVIVCYL